MKEKVLHEEKIVDEEKVVPLDPPKDEFISMEKVLKIHDKLIYKNVLLVENAGKNIDRLLKNMKAGNKIIKGITSSIGDINRILRTIIRRLPKE